MAIKFNGSQSALLLQDILAAGDQLTGICNRNLEFERNRELIEQTTLEGYEVGHVLGLKRGRVTFNNISVFIEDGDEGYYDELCRQWFETGKLLLCRLRDEVDDNVREIVFFGYMESYRIVRNNNEVANFDITILQTGYDASIDCPLTIITNENDEGNYIINVSFPTSGFASSYVVNLYDEADTLIESQEFDEFDDTIEAIFDTGIEANALYHITQVIDGIESANCAVGPFLSYNIACPILNLTVDEDSVIVDLTPPDDITRIIIQLSENQVDIIDGVNDPEPFADPIATFTGLDPDTTYYVRATIITESGAGTIYTRTCAWVEFTTGEPYDPPASNQYEVQFAFDDMMTCAAESVTVYGDATPFAPGVELFLDAGLTTPILTYNYVRYNETIYHYNEGFTPGAVGALTGTSCS